MNVIILNKVNKQYTLNEVYSKSLSVYIIKSNIKVVANSPFH